MYPYRTPRQRHTDKTYSLDYIGPSRLMASKNQYHPHVL